MSKTMVEDYHPSPTNNPNYDPWKAFGGLDISFPFIESNDAKVQLTIQASPSPFLPSNTFGDQTPIQTNTFTTGQAMAVSKLAKDLTDLSPSINQCTHIRTYPTYTPPATSNSISSKTNHFIVKSTSENEILDEIEAMLHKEYDPLLWDQEFEGNYESELNNDNFHENIASLDAFELKFTFYEAIEGFRNDNPSLLRALYPEASTLELLTIYEHRIFPHRLVTKATYPSYDITTKANTHDENAALKTAPVFLDPHLPSNPQPQPQPQPQQYWQNMPAPVTASAYFPPSLFEQKTRKAVESPEKTPLIPPFTPTTVATSLTPPPSPKNKKNASTATPTYKSTSIEHHHFPPPTIINFSLNDDDENKVFDNDDPSSFKNDDSDTSNEVFDDDDPYSSSFDDKSTSVDDINFPSSYYTNDENAVYDTDDPSCQNHPSPTIQNSVFDKDDPTSNSYDNSTYRDDDQPSLSSESFEDDDPPSSSFDNSDSD